MGALVRERPEVLAPELGVSGATPYRWKHQALIDPAQAGEEESAAGLVPSVAMRSGRKGISWFPMRVRCEF